MRPRFLATLAIALAVSLLVAARKHEQDPAFRQIDEIVRSLSAITGLTEQHPVPCDTISQKHLRQLLRKRTKSTLRPEEIRATNFPSPWFKPAAD